MIIAHLVDLALFFLYICFQTIVRQALIVLKSLAGNDEVKSEIAKLGGVELVVAAMLKHQNNAAIADAACRVLTAITLRTVENCKRVIDCQGHQHIVQAMKLHPDDVHVQVSITVFLRKGKLTYIPVHNIHILYTYIHTHTHTHTHTHIVHICKYKQM